MNARNLAIAWTGALFATALSGCIITSTNPPPTRNAYDTCGGSDSCAAGTTCIGANTTVTAGATTGGQFCSTTCVTSADCPPDAAGNGRSCVTAAGTSQCYSACGGGNTCPANETCASITGVSVCVPNAPITGTCGGASQACCTGGTCNGGLQCVGTTCQACGNAGQSCCGGNACATGLACGSNGLCGACGTSGAPCCPGNTCSTGLTCAAGLCSSCGAAGQACCPGGHCADASLACGTDNLCNLAPYSACSGSSLGAACLGGTNSAGQVIDTVCTRPEIPNPGPDGFCTHRCSGMAGSMLECPQWAGAGRSYTYNCYLLQGAADPMCFVDCTGGQTCPAGTGCVMFNTSTGAPVQICMPPVS